jgi:hypothetical protein
MPQAIAMWLWIGRLSNQPRHRRFCSNLVMFFRAQSRSLRARSWSGHWAYLALAPCRCRPHPIGLATLTIVLNLNFTVVINLTATPRHFAIALTASPSPPLSSLLFLVTPALAPPSVTLLLALLLLPPPSSPPSISVSPSSSPFLVLPSRLRVSAELWSTLSICPPFPKSRRPAWWMWRRRNTGTKISSRSTPAELLLSALLRAPGSSRRSEMGGDKMYSQNPDKDKMKSSSRCQFRGRLRFLFRPRYAVVFQDTVQYRKGMKISTHENPCGHIAPHSLINFSASEDIKAFFRKCQRQCTCTAPPWNVLADLWWLFWHPFM